MKKCGGYRGGPDGLVLIGERRLFGANVLLAAFHLLCPLCPQGKLPPWALHMMGDFAQIVTVLAM